MIVLLEWSASNDGMSHTQQILNKSIQELQMVWVSKQMANISQKMPISDAEVCLVKLHTGAPDGLGVQTEVGLVKLHTGAPDGLGVQTEVGLVKLHTGAPDGLGVQTEVGLVNQTDGQHLTENAYLRCRGRLSKPNRWPTSHRKCLSQMQR